MNRVISIISIILIILMAILLPANYTSATETTEFPQTTEYPDEPGRHPDIASQAAIVIDAKTGQILYEKNAYDTMYPASITKILTALVALENGYLSSTITMSEEAVYGIERGSSHIALDVGEEISFEDALYAVMLVSANEAAWAVAEHVAGSLDAFCDMMNQKAEELGCVSTHFVNANGLHDDDHYTCAYDMALIAQAAIQNEEFMKITSTIHHVIEPTNLQEEERNLWQDNKLIRESSDYYYEYCQGAKTGFTDQARGTLVAWAEKDGVQLICVTLHGYPTTVNYTDTKALFEYYFNNYTYHTPLENYQFTAEQLTSAENILNGHFGGTNKGTMELHADTTRQVLIPNSVSSDDLTIDFSVTVETISEGVIGTLNITDGTTTFLEVPVTYSGYISSEDEDAIAEAIANGEISEQKSKVPKALIIILAIILIAIAIAVFVYFRIKYVQKQREAYRLRRDQARKQRKSF